MNLSRLAIKYSRITIAFWLSIVFAGIFALSSLQYNLFPDVTFPVIVIRAQSETSTVIETEKKVTIPIELALSSLANLTDIESTTYPQHTVINLLFEPGLNLDEIKNKVQNFLTEISFVSQVKWEIIPLNLNESTAVNYVLLSDRYSLRELSKIAQSELIPRINTLQEVQRVDLLGDSKLGNTLVRFNGQTGVALKVVKTANGNTLNVVKQVTKIVTELQQQLTDVQLVLAETQAKYIQEATQATIDALISAIAISVITIFVCLRSWRATLISAIAIPLSLLGTFIFMATAGFNLETLTLLALALVIGIIVDDAIVEVENISRYIEEGKSPYKAALLATREIGFTVSVSTLTIAAVFLPIALMGSTLGKFFRPFGLTISVAVLTSLLVARTLSPVLAVLWLKKPKQNPRQKYNFLNWYRHVLSWSLSHRQQVIAIAVAISVTGVVLTSLIPQGFIPNLDRGEFNVFYQTSLPNISLEKSENQSDGADISNFNWLKKIAQSPEKILLRRSFNIGTELEAKILTVPEVDSVYTVAGYQGQANQGKIYIKLKENRSLKTDVVQENVRQVLGTIPNLKISVEDIPFVETGSDKPFKIALEGENLTQLKQTAIAIKEKIVTLPSLIDVTFTGENQEIPLITHLNGQRVIYLTANLNKDYGIGDVTQEALAIAEPLLPPEITINTQGDSARSGKILQEFAITLIIAILLMLALLYLPFGRWLEPLVIALSLPLAIIGAMLALLISGSDFSMISLIGLIFLLGLLDKNGILLMDYVNQLRKKGIPRTQALIETGTIRLRPIIMTTASTILGMLPIAFGWGAAAELRQPMAVAIIGGLIASSLLSLIVIPVLYSLLEDFFVKK